MHPRPTAVHVESRHGGGALVAQNLDTRYRILEIDRRCEEWKAQEYRKLLEKIGDGTVHAAASSVPEGGQRLVASSEPPNRPAAAPLAGPTYRQQPEPSIVEVVDQDDDDGHERTHTTEAAAPEIAPRDDMESDSDLDETFVGIIAKLCAAGNSSRIRTAIFCAAGVGDRRLATREATCARKTPDMPWMTFSHVFGGTPYSERPISTRIPDYKTAGCFLCTSIVTQPLAPTGIGKPGVILSPPGAALIGDTFHVFVDPSVDGKKKIQYRGIYTAVHAPNKVEIDEWHSLPRQCTRMLLTHLRKMGRRVSRVGDLQARCSLRKSKRSGSDPSPAEIREWLRKYRQGSVSIEYNSLHDSFDSGKENFDFQVIKCVGYDIRLAEIIQRGVNYQAVVYSRRA